MSTKTGVTGNNLILHKVLVVSDQLMSSIHTEGYLENPMILYTVLTGSSRIATFNTTQVANVLLTC